MRAKMQLNAFVYHTGCLLYRDPEHTSCYGLSWKMQAVYAIKLSSSVTRYIRHSVLGYDIQNVWPQRAEPQINSLVGTEKPVLSAHVEWLVQKMRRKEKYPQTEIEFPVSTAGNVRLHRTDNIYFCMGLYYDVLQLRRAKIQKDSFVQSKTSQHQTGNPVLPQATTNKI